MHCSVVRCTIIVIFSSVTTRVPGEVSNLSQSEMLEVDLVELSHPPPIHQAVGHWVLRGDDAKQDVCGYVASIEEETGMMSVLYEDESGDATGADVEEQVPYAESGLVWMQPDTTKTGYSFSKASTFEMEPRTAADINHPTPQRPSASEGHVYAINSKKIHVDGETNGGERSTAFDCVTQPGFEKVIGYFVKIDDDVAEVVDASKSSQMLKVRFVVEIRGNEVILEDESEIEEVPYRTRELQWMILRKYE